MLSIPRTELTAPLALALAFTMGCGSSSPPATPVIRVTLRLDSASFSLAAPDARGPVVLIGDEAREVVADRQRISIVDAQQIPVPGEALSWELTFPEEARELPLASFELQTMQLTKIKKGPDKLLRELSGANWVRVQPGRGWEIDRAARDVIEKAGYGEHFVHRLGHSLGFEAHSNGVNLDDWETHDTRAVINGVGVTIEPGIYLPEFGVRSEIDVYMGEDGPEITGDRQTGIVQIETG